MTAPGGEDFDFFGANRPATTDAGPVPTVPSRLGFVPPSRPGALAGKGSRWVKSDTTFGPAGRLVATLALLIPFTFLVVAGVLTFDPFVLGGAGIWAVLMVVGLRQTWAVVRPHHRR